MTRVEAGDIIFSFSDTWIKNIGVALSNAVTEDKPKVFGDKGQNWSQEGWKIPVKYETQEPGIRPKEHMHILGPLLPSKYSPLQASGNGLQGVYLTEVPTEMAQALMMLLNAVIPDLPNYSLDGFEMSSEDQEILAMRSLEATEKATLVMARRGQGIFRDRVRTLEKSCRVTGVSSDKFLIASHIKPWKLSDNQEKLDGNNGLFLSPHVDKLFDNGFISFTAKGKMLVSDLLDAEVLPKWNIDPLENYGRFNSDQEYFLDYHRAVKFRDEHNPHDT